MKKSSVGFSIVVPVYNSEKTLPELVMRLNQVFNSAGYSYELIMVDDSSYDNSWDVLRELKSGNEHITIIRLARNFGQHNATLCGFNYANGDFIITIDDDLQHPPEEIPKLIVHIQSDDFNVVYGKYKPKNARYIENVLSRIFQKVIHHILGVPDNIFSSSFGIYKKSLIKNMIVIKNSYPFIFALVVQSTTSRKIGHIDVQHYDRIIGLSNYGLIKYIKLSLNLIINYSSWPLLFISYIGFIVSLLSILYGLSIIIYKMINSSYGLMGWNSLMVAVSFLGGLLLFSMGIIGEYLKRILMETSYGQQYVVSELEL